MTPRVFHLKRNTLVVKYTDDPKHPYIYFGKSGSWAVPTQGHVEGDNGSHTNIKTDFGMLRIAKGNGESMLGHDPLKEVRYEPVEEDGNVIKLP